MSFISYDTSKDMLELLPIQRSRYEQVLLSEALGRVLAEDIVTKEAYPAYPTAAMDGYAIVHSDLDDGEIAIVGEDNPAGSSDAPMVVPGICVKTFTGAIMPQGSDTLIPIENVEVREGKIIIKESVPFGFSVRPVGESYQAGEILIEKGRRIGFAEIGVMAGLNIVHVKVALKPRVAILATGSEILDIGQPSQNPSQIRSSNNYTLAALAQSAGAEVIQLGIIKDDKQAITQGFENALATADIVVSTGGVSVGDYDFVKDIIPRLGAEVIYKGVKIKPGQHLMLAQRNEKFLLALPGFAYSSTVTFILYGIALIHKMLGKKGGLHMVEAKLKEPFTKRSKKSEFTACNLYVEDGAYVVDFEGKKVGSSAILTNLLGESALMMSGEDDELLEEGTMVHVIALDRF